MNEVYTDQERKKPYQSLYDRCKEKDPTLSSSELNIVSAAYPQLVKDYFKQEKYFTPSLEDIRVGYECEKRVFDYNDIYNSDKFEYKKHIIEKGDFHDIFWLQSTNGSCRGYFRTAYLNKEQIEAEGWKQEEVKIQDLMVWGEYFQFQKGDTSLLFYKDYTIHIFEKNKLIRYTGPCKDINTFRYICKLLNI